MAAEISSLNSAADNSIAAAGSPVINWIGYDNTFLLHTKILLSAPNSVVYSTPGGCCCWAGGCCCWAGGGINSIPLCVERLRFVSSTIIRILCSVCEICWISTPVAAAVASGTLVIKLKRVNNNNLRLNLLKIDGV